jgi:hypothetical protein
MASTHPTHVGATVTQLVHAPARQHAISLLRSRAPPSPRQSNQGFVYCDYQSSITRNFERRIGPQSRVRTVGSVFTRVRHESSPSRRPSATRRMAARESRSASPSRAKAVEKIDAIASSFSPSQEHASRATRWRRLFDPRGRHGDSICFRDVSGHAWDPETCPCPKE